MTRNILPLMPNLLSGLQVKQVKFLRIMQDRLLGILNQNIMLYINEEEMLCKLPCFIVNTLNSRNHITKEKLLHRSYLLNFCISYNTALDSK